MSYQTPDGIRVLQDEQRDEMIALDGVADVTLYRSRENVEGFYYRNTGFSGKLYGVDDHYFSVYGYEVRSGRGFTARDFASASKNVILDETAAKTLFSSDDPIGKIVEISGEPFTVVGVVSLSWLFFTIFGMLPFYLSGSVDTIANAFFETMSGFTTTGATILDDIESLSHGMLFWRSLTQWIGGLGIVFFTIAILPIFTSGGVQLFSAESTGVIHNRTHPKINVMAKWLWAVYLILTLLETILLMFGGMNLFDAICHSFTTTATGGYSTKQASISYWNSPFIEYVVSVFMLLSSMNFALFLMCLKGKVGKIFKDEEVRWFLGSVAILTGMMTIALVFHNHYDWELAFRKSLFQVTTVHTSCGFATDDYNLWPPFTWLLLFIAMLSGGCTGSTSGGIKNMRLLIVARAIRNEFKHLLHPNAVLPVRVNQRTVSSSIVSTVVIFIVFYFIIILAGWTILLFLGVGFTESVSTVISSIGNVGPGLGAFGPAYSWNALPDAAKWVLSFLMLIGRLELFSVLLLFYPSFWKKQ